MKTGGNKASEDRMKMIAVAGFVVVAVAILYFEYFSGGAPAAPATVATAPAVAAPASGPATPAAADRGHVAKTVGTTSAGLDPTLHMDAMLVSESITYAGSGRNIFSMNSAPPPVVIQKPVAPPRPVAQVVVPCPPNCPPPPPPPPPPPIPLKFFGIETSASGAKQAFLLHEDAVYTASAGDVVMRRYRVIAIEPKSIQVEDMQNNNRQTLPLLTN
ncbi:MAG TPA: hypothetical protein VGN01_16555 [Acidobacteriaceae bacterium]|jgi:hypothetical protein